MLFKFLVLRGIHPLNNQIDELDWGPGYEWYRANFKEEDMVHVSGLKVGFEQNDWHEISYGGCHQNQHHLHVHVVDLRVHV